MNTLSTKSLPNITCVSKKSQDYISLAVSGSSTALSTVLFFHLFQDILNISISSSISEKKTVLTSKLTKVEWISFKHPLVSFKLIQTLRSEIALPNFQIFHFLFRVWQKHTKQSIT